LLRFSDSALPLNRPCASSRAFPAIRCDRRYGLDDAPCAGDHAFASRRRAVLAAISTPDGVFVEVDGRTAGARAVAWIIDASVRGVEEGGAGGRIGAATK
jgi:hypothetical protein